MMTAPDRAAPDRAVRLGTFDVERRWRPAGLATLPAVRDPGADRAVAAMDEMLAMTCDPGDVLVTGQDVPASFLALLHEVGVEVVHRVAPAAADSPSAGSAFGSPSAGSALGSPLAGSALGSPLAESASGSPSAESAVDSQSSVERRLLLSPVDGLRGAAFTPYAVLPETARLVAEYGFRSQLPTFDTVRRVSSKAWSNALVEELGLPGGGVVVDSVPALVAAVAGFGGEPVLLKDPHGVGGRGIIEVASPRVLNTVCRVLTKQVERGAAVELLVQRRMDRVADFSAQFDVTPGGQVCWRGVQSLENVGFSHVGSRPPAEALRGRLAGSGYRSVMTDVGAALAGAGYHGPVCVDSMLLRDGTVVPVLEINPRMSIGMITMLAAHRLTGSAAGARLAVRTVRCDRHPWRMFDDLVALMRDRGVLFAGGGTGLFPLAVNTLQTSRGRLNCLVVARDAGEDHRLGAALDDVVRAVGEDHRLGAALEDVVRAVGGQTTAVGRATEVGRAS
jgi:hypothetical protein